MSDTVTTFRYIVPVNPAAPATPTTLVNEVFEQSLELLIWNTAVPSGNIVMPVSQPGYKVIKIYNSNPGAAEVVNIKFGGGSAIVLKSGTTMVITYTGVPSLLENAVGYIYSFEVVQASTTLRFAATEVTIDPITFVPTFTRDIGLSLWTGGTLARGFTPIQSVHNIIHLAVNMEFINGKVFVSNTNMVDPNHFEIYIANALTWLDSVANFTIFIAYE